MSFSAQPPKMAMQLFEPDPHTVYTIEEAAHLAQMSRHMILVYCKRGLISPAVESRKHGYYFNGDTVRSLRRIQNLRTIGGINLAGIKIILDLSNEVEELRSAVTHNGSLIP
jgi:MerR family transcriptional regulator/heat shock protein HspR